MTQGEPELLAPAPSPDALSTELAYVALLFALFVVPRILQRWRLPSAITSLALGAAVGMGFGWFRGDQTIQLLSAFGIVALFLFAGLEVDAAELRRGARIIGHHLLVRVGLLALGTLLVAVSLGLGLRAAVLVSLALLTPSTGFILNSLGAFGLTAEERYWVKAKVIATELVALTVLFVALQSTTVSRLALSAAALVALIAVLPLLFRAFAAVIVPFAPKSEFAFLLMLAIVCAYATRQLGVYYLVGAFVVGVAARRFRERLPAMASEEMLHAVEVFASFFVPFYFFHAGLLLYRDDFRIPALVLGLLFLATAGAVGMASVVLHRRIALRERPRRSARVALSMVPTLVFTLVIAAILRDQFLIPEAVFGGLVVYAIATTLLPGLLLHTPAPAYDAPVLSDVGGAGSEPSGVGETNAPLA